MMATSTPLQVKCEIGSRKENPNLWALVGPFTQLFSAYLADHQLDGTWTVEPFKRTGDKGQDKVVYKRMDRNDIRGGKMSLIFMLRPLDRDSAWLAYVMPPPYMDMGELAKRFAGEQVAQQNVESAIVTSKPRSNYAPNQVALGKVVAHGPVGLEIMIDDKYPGFVPLADICEGKYDRKEMLRFPVGKKLRFVISAVGPDKMVCSTRVEGIVATDRSDDVFTGKPSDDGSLKLNGFHRAPDRVYDLIKWLAMDAIDRDPNPIPNDAAIDLVIEYMITNYGAKTVERRAAAVTLGAICSAIEPMLAKTDYGYAITDFGWSEIGGKASYRVKGPAFGAVARTLPENEYAEKSHNVLAPQAEEVQPKAWTSEQAEEEPEDDTVSLHEISEYLGAAMRLIEIKRQIETLEGEQRSLKVYVESREHVRIAAERLNKQINRGSKS